MLPSEDDVHMRDGGDIDAIEDDREDDLEDDEGYGRELGERLRNVRSQKGYSLHDVEVASGGEFKASVLGAYERGERAVSIPRLVGLARFYRVPPSELLPASARSTAPRRAVEGLRIDLQALGRIAGSELEVIERYLTSIQARRGDYNGRTITLRASDVDALAAVLDLDVAALRADLVAVGVASVPDV